MPHVFVVALVWSLACALVAEESRTGDAPVVNPLSSASDFPLLLRRTTLVVRDLETSLELYRDALGMSVIYDQVITRPHATEDREQVLRLVFLKAAHDYVGVLGLLEYEYDNPQHPIHKKPVRREGFTPGNAVLLFNTQALAEKWPLISSASGAEVISNPKLVEYPAYDGVGKIRVMVSSLYDTDGYILEVNQILSD
jgi:catechol 2,3-dioxygenase-like lactoylglutathione lyase family enzyme